MCVCLCLRSRTIDRPSCTRWKFYNHQSVIGIEQLIHVTGGVLQAIAIVCSNEMQADDSRQNVGYSIITMPKSKSVLFKTKKIGGTRSFKVRFSTCNWQEIAIWEPKPDGNLSKGFPNIRASGSSAATEASSFNHLQVA